MRNIFLFISFLSISVGLFAQPDAIKTEDVRDLFPEEILIHSDRDFYIAGQVVWFKVYTIASTSFHLQALSKTVYAELTGPDGAPVSQARIQIKNGLGAGSFLLPLDASSGVYEIRAYTNWMKNSPPVVFHKVLTVVNTHQTFDTTAFTFVDELNTVSDRAGNQNVRLSSDNRLRQANGLIKVQSDKNTYKQRSPVNLSLSAEGLNTSTVANLSITVVKKSDLTIPGGFFEKEYGQVNKTTGYQFDNSNVVLPETDGFVVAVLAKNLEDKPVKDIPVLVSLTGKLAEVRYGESDERGIAYFNFKNLFGDKQILVKTKPEYEDSIHLEVLKPFAVNGTGASLPKGVFRKSFFSDVEEMHDNFVVNRAFDSTLHERFYPENKDSLSFYGKPYATYLLDDYKRFVTMEEVLREYVQQVSVRIRKKDYHLLVLNKQLTDLRYFIEVPVVMEDNDPLVLIDGIPVSQNTLMKYDPLKVRKLEVVAERYRIGKNVYDGILSFTTYDGHFEDVELGKNDLLADINGWQYQREFYIPDYNNVQLKNSRIPDFRDVLLWRPQVEVSPSETSNVTFFTGDLTGEFIVIVKGLTADGYSVSETLEFEVTK